MKSQLTNQANFTELSEEFRREENKELYDYETHSFAHINTYLKKIILAFMLIAILLTLIAIPTEMYQPVTNAITKFLM